MGRNLPLLEVQSVKGGQIVLQVESTIFTGSKHMSPLIQNFYTYPAKTLGVIRQLL